MLRDAPRQPPTAKSLRRFVVSAAIAGLAMLAALWSVAPHAAASSHCDTQASAALIRDCRTLIDLKGDLDPNNQLNWNEFLPMEHWEGIFASQDRGVSTLEIYETMFGGTFTLAGASDPTVPAGLGSLPNLRFLKMWRVGLTGSIPAELGNLSNLEELRLDQNALTGSIPTGLGSLSNLGYLSLTLNQLSGGIPSDFGSLSSATYLSLDRNFLGLQTHPTAGNPAPAAVQNPIPNSLGNLSNLVGLSLGVNRLSGSIPSALGNLSDLNVLFLEINDFTGSIPAALGNLSELDTLSLWGNSLSGSIPSQLGNLSKLTYLDLSNNQLTGSIPTSIGRLSKLRSLYLNENQLSGSIPTQLGNLTELQILRLETNRLNGSIPTDLGDLEVLKELSLARNELSGAIPSELGNLLLLQDLNLNDNGLSSNIPAELGNLSTSTDDDNKPLDYISLSCNLLTGNAPSELGDLPSLRVLLLDKNKLNIEAADRPASFSNIGFVRWTSGTVCPRGQPDVEPPSSDDVPPTFEEAELSRDGLTIVLTYNESLDSTNGPASTDFTVKVDGREVTVSTVTVRIRKVTLNLAAPVTEHQVVTVAYEDPTSGNDENAIQDRAGNDAADLTETQVTNESTIDDEIAPTLDSVALSSDGADIILSYSEVLESQDKPDHSAFKVLVEDERRNIASVSVSDRLVTLQLTSRVTQGQSVAVSYFDPTTGDDANAIQDRAGNDAATFEDETVPNTSETLDTRGPKFVRAAMSTDGLSITLVYDEVLDDFNFPATSAFAVAVDGESAEPSQVEMNGRTVVLRLSSEVRELQDVTVSYTDPTNGDDANAIQDAAGNDAADLSEATVTNESTVDDEIAPEFSSAAISSDGTTITLTYTEILKSDAGPGATNFVVKVEGETRGVASVRVSGQDVQLRLSTPVTEQQNVTVSYFDPTTGDDANAIQDRAGNDAADLPEFTITNVSTAQDNRAPLFSRAALSTNGLSITLVYDEALDDDAGPAASDFSVDLDGDSSEPSQVSLSGRTVVLTLTTAVRELQDVTVSYTDPTNGDDANAIQDAAGNDADNLVDQMVTNSSTVLDHAPPVFQSVAMSTDGATITLTYDEVLDNANGPATANFQLMVQGERRDVSDVTVSGKTVELELGAAITTGQTVTVTYSDPTAGINDLHAIQDRSGNDADS